jgi:muramoyltetrapeptide carboxypeptidase LdcA involved in peptidoglycan recycling
MQKGDTIGICAPSSGVGDEIKWGRLDNAIKNIKDLGYNAVETPEVRQNIKCVSADSEKRAANFISLYENPDVTAIIPIWGGEFLMDILPHLDFEKIAALPAKWLCGYSDTTTLSFPLTVVCSVASVHGSNLMNMGFARIHETDSRAFDVMSNIVTEQKSWDTYGAFTSWDDYSAQPYNLNKPSVWKSLREEDKNRDSFSGMMIGGCMDTLCKLIGTRFAPVEAFLNKYKQHGFIWAMESCEMSAAEIYRTLWQMRECGWFKYCKGFLFGRPDGYSHTGGFELTDALKDALGSLNVPVIYDADIGHIPPQMQIVNGALGKVAFCGGTAVVTQELKGV